MKTIKSLLVFGLLALSAWAWAGDAIFITPWHQVSSPTTFYSPATFQDDVALNFGTGSTASLRWETADPNSNELLLALPNGTSIDVPVFVIGDAGAVDVDLTFFNGFTVPTLALLSPNEGFYLAMRHNGTDPVFDTNTGEYQFDSNLYWDVGDAVTAARYSAGRDLDATNQLHFNAPTGATMEWSINDVGVAFMSSTTLAVIDDTGIALGNTLASPNAQFIWETADANSNELILSLPTGGATDVPVLVIGDASLPNVDLGFFDGVTSPTLALVAADESDYIYIQHTGTGASLSTDDGPFNFQLGSTVHNTLALEASGTTVFNENSIDIDFRIESDNAASMVFLDAANNTLTINGGGTANETFGIIDFGRTSGVPKSLRVASAGHTGMTAATEVNNVLFDFSSLKTWASGAGPLATQSEYLLDTPRYAGSAAGALTITDAATFEINGPPQAVSNMTITNAYSFLIDSGNARFDGLVQNQVQSVTVADSGDGNPATATITPTSNYIEVTCNDADGCTMTMGETDQKQGVRITIVNVSSNTANYADTAGVTELPAAFAQGQYDVIGLVYLSDRWAETMRSNN